MKNLKDKIVKPGKDLKMFVGTDGSIRQHEQADIFS